MSDEAVVVFVTKSMEPDEGEYEYRVSYVQNLEDLYGAFDPVTGKWSGDNSVILDLFTEKDIYTDEESAMLFAQSVLSAYDELEFGICVIRDFKSKYFYEL